MPANLRKGVGQILKKPKEMIFIFTLCGAEYQREEYLIINVKNKEIRSLSFGVNKEIYEASHYLERSYPRDYDELIADFNINFSKMKPKVMHEAEFYFRYPNFSFIMSGRKFKNNRKIKFLEITRDSHISKTSFKNISLNVNFTKSYIKFMVDMYFEAAMILEEFIIQKDNNEGDWKYLVNPFKDCSEKEIEMYDNLLDEINRLFMRMEKYNLTNTKNFMRLRDPEEKGFGSMENSGRSKEEALRYGMEKLDREEKELYEMEHDLDLE